MEGIADCDITFYLMTSSLYPHTGELLYDVTTRSKFKTLTLKTKPQLGLYKQGPINAL